MKGSYDVVVQSSRVQFKFTLNRNITIVRGDSATGKSTLIGMVADYEQNGESSGVTVSCAVPCRALSGNRWLRDLEEIENSIVFVDEASSFLRSHEFARAVKNSSNYYVLATRIKLSMLPYSVDEIYELKNVGRTKYPPAKRLYTHFRKVYGTHSRNLEKPDVVVVEDSNAGYEFFSALCKREGIECVSAGGRSRIYDVAKSLADKTVLVVADGAAFGPEMELVSSLGKSQDISLFLPESFEWMILKSGLIKDSDLPTVLENPSAFIESKDYFSWENFFTAELVTRTRQSYLQYSKGRLNENYLEEREMRAIAELAPEAVRQGAAHTASPNDNVG